METWPAAGRRPQGRRGGAEAARRSDGRTLLHCPGLGVGVDLGVGLGSDFRVRVSDNSQGWMFIALASFGLPIAAGKKTTESHLRHARSPYVEPKEAQDSKGARRSGARQEEPKEAQNSKEARRSGARQDDCDSAVCLVVATLSLRTRAGLPPHIWRSLATVRWQGLECWHARKEWREWCLRS